MKYNTLVIPIEVRSTDEESIRKTIQIFIDASTTRCSAQHDICLSFRQREERTTRNLLKRIHHAELDSASLKREFQIKRP